MPEANLQGLLEVKAKLISGSPSKGSIKIFNLRDVPIVAWVTVAIVFLVVQVALRRSTTTVNTIVKVKKE